MALSPDQIPALTAELTNDPLGLGYGVSDQNDADLLNEVRPSIMVRRTVEPTHDLTGLLVLADVLAATADQRQALAIYLGSPNVNMSKDNFRQAMGSIFGPGTATRTAVAAWQDRQGSRAEQLFGTNTIVSHADVALARGRS